MDLSAEPDELAHGLSRERRLIELTIDRVQLAAVVAESGEEPPQEVSLTEVHRLVAHLHHEEMFRAVLVAGIGHALGTSIERDLPELTANAPRDAAARLSECRVISAADLLASRQRAPEAVAAARTTPPGHGTAVIELDPQSCPAELTHLAGRVVQPSLRRFVRPDD